MPSVPASAMRPLRRAVALIGGSYTTETYDDDGEVETYLLMSEHGGDLLLTGGELHTAFLYAQATADHANYGGWSALIEGVGPDSSPVDVRQALGEPRRSTPHYLTYEADGGFVQFDFSAETLTMVTVMRELVGSGDPAPV